MQIWQRNSEKFKWLFFVGHSVQTDGDGLLSDSAPLQFHMQCLYSTLVCVAEIPRWLFVYYKAASSHDHKLKVMMSDVLMCT